MQPDIFVIMDIIIGKSLLEILTIDLILSHNYPFEVNYDINLKKLSMVVMVLRLINGAG